MSREWSGVNRTAWERADVRRREDTDYDVSSNVVARRVAQGVAAGLDRWIVKATAESRASTTTYAADTDLVLPVTSGTYSIVGRVLATSTSATPDIKLQVSYPASSSVLGNYVSNAGTATVIAEDATSPAISTNFDIAANGITLVQFEVVLVCGAAGNFTVDWAQNTSNSTATTVRAGSFLRWRKTV